MKNKKRQLVRLRARLRKEYGVADFMTASLIAKTILKSGRSWLMNELSYRSDAVFTNHIGGCSCCGPSIKEVVFRGVKIIALNFGDRIEVNGKELRV